HLLAAYVDVYRKALEDCEDLYRSAALEVLHSQPELAKDARRDFLHRMIDLHRGLALKIFVDVAFVERRWSDEALELAEELFPAPLSKGSEARAGARSAGSLSVPNRPDVGRLARSI